MTQQEIKSRIEVLTVKIEAEYAERDRQVQNECELLARHHDEQATELDYQRACLRLRLQDMANTKKTYVVCSRLEGTYGKWLEEKIEGDNAAAAKMRELEAMGYEVTCIEAAK